MRKIIIISISLFVIAAGFFVLKSKEPSVIPSISVLDQSDLNGEVLVKEVVTKNPAWLVIQTNDDGVPGPVIGFVKIAAGKNTDVKVKVDKDKATASLFAMIHEDNGTKDKFDFPENDLPLMYKMDMVAKTFKLN